MICTKKELDSLPNCGRGASVRRAFGMLTKAEMERVSYIRKMQFLAHAMASGKVELNERPDWMKERDWKDLKSLCSLRGGVTC